MPAVLTPPPTFTPPTGTGRVPLMFGGKGQGGASYQQIQQTLNDANQKNQVLYQQVQNNVSDSLKIYGQSALSAWNDLKFATTVVGLALQESYEVTSAFVSGLTNRPRLAPNANLLRRTSPENDNDTDPVTKNHPYIKGVNNYQVKTNPIQIKYQRRIEKSPEKIPVPEDPDTPTTQKPVVTVTQSVRNKGYGGTLHLPLAGSTLTVQQLDTATAMAKASALSQLANQDFSNWLKQSNGEKIDQPVDFRNTAFTYFPLGMGLESFLVGTSSIEILEQTYRQAANQATINPATTGIHTEIEIEPVPVQVQDPEPNKFPVDHWNVGSVEQVKNSIIFPEPIETQIEDLMTFMGKQTVSPDPYGDTDFYTIPSRETFSVAGDVVNGTEIAPEVSQMVKVNTVFDLNFLATAATYFRQGLHEYPMTAVSPAQVGQKVEKGEEKAVQIPNAASLNAYNHAVVDKKIGDFPLEISVKDENGNPVDLRNVPGVSPGSDQEKKESFTNEGNFLASSIAAASGLLASLGAGIFKGTNMNFGMLAGIAASTAGATAAAVKAAGCACAAADAIGGKNNPTCEETKMPFDYSKTGASPRGKTGKVEEFMKGGTGCFPSTVGENNESIFDYLKRIDFAANIIKETNFKRASDLDKEEERIKKVFDRIKKNNKERWEKFKDAVKKEDSYLNKHYPVKPKIVERGADGLPKS